MGLRIKDIGTLLMGSFLVIISILFIYKGSFGFSVILSLVIGLGLIAYYISKSLNKEFTPLEEIIEKQKKRQNALTRVFDRLTFFDMFMIWILIVSIFGAVYFFGANQESYLFYAKTNEIVNKISDCIYFSFITATSTGFGDIVPHGSFKSIAVMEAVFGLVLLATLTSKLVSIKEDAILTEIYEISFSERLSRLRSSLLAFRQNLTRIINRIEEKSISKREVDDLQVYLSSFETALNEVIAFFGKSESNVFLKEVDAVNTELIFNSILHSFSKLDELINSLKRHKIPWKNEPTIKIINNCININEKLFEQLNESKTIPEKIAIDMNSQKRKIVSIIKDGLL